MVAELFTSYLSTKKGRYAVFALISIVIALAFRFFGGPPPLNQLSTADGLVESVKGQDGIKRGEASIWVSLRTANGKLVEAQYFANRGDQHASQLAEVDQQQVRMWYEQGEPNTIYQLDQGSKRVIDYDTRKSELTGSNGTVFGYVSVASVVFVLITLSLIRDISATRSRTGRA